MIQQSATPICSHESGYYENNFDLSIISPYDSTIDYSIKYATNQIIDLSNINDGHHYTKPIKISRTMIFKYMGTREGSYRISDTESKIFVLNDIINKFPIAFIGSCLAKGLSNRCYHLDDVFEIFIGNSHTPFLLTDCYTNINENICGYANSNYKNIFKLLHPHTFLHSSPYLFKLNNFLLRKEIDAIEKFYEIYSKYKTNNQFYVLINGPIFNTRKKIFTQEDITTLKHDKFYKIHLKNFQQIQNSNITLLSVVDFFADMMLDGLVMPQDIFGYDQDHYSDFANSLILIWLSNILGIYQKNNNSYLTLLDKINNNNNIIKFIEKYGL
jgi:hypothetical protein